LTALGGRVFAIAGSSDKIARCLALGAEAAADRKAGPWRSAVQAWAPDGVDIVLDPVGGTLPDDVRCMAVDGRIVLIGVMGGLSAELDLIRVLSRRIRVIGSTLRSRAPEAKAQIVAGTRRDVWPLLDAGRIAPVIDTVMDIADVEAAHARVASDANVGKVVLTWSAA
jgi:NADPH:quinone reductase-like Zn-dependent oxidoreductase